MWAEHMRKRKSFMILLNNDSAINNTSLIENSNALKEKWVAYKSRLTKYAKKPILATSDFKLSQGPHDLDKSDMVDNEWWKISNMMYFG